MYRIAFLGMLVTLSACQSGALTTAQAVPPQVTAWRATSEGGHGRHLYVSVSTSTHYPSIERYRLVNGVPETKPDRVYGGYGGFLALSDDGTLYVSGSDLSGDNLIFAFSPRNAKPVRTIRVPNPRRCGASSGEQWSVSALASDSQGYVFAAIYSYAGGAPRRMLHVPCEGVAIFAPDANGKANPVQTISLGHAVVTGLAVDGSDNLYLSSYPFKVIEYANAVTAPKRTRVFKTHLPARFTSLATDGAGNLFISNTEYGYKTGWIDRYAPTAKPKGPPTSEIQLEGSNLHMLFSIAVAGRDLYASDTSQSVDLYQARKNGPQSPFYSFAASNVTSVAVGP
jgi:sugar lactone lactonase YvrE